MMAVNPAPLVPQADNHTSPIHHDDVCCKEQNYSRQNEPDGGHAIPPNNAGQWRRAERVQQLATRNVDLHGWHVTPSPDRQGLVIEHSHYRVSLMLGKRLADYVTSGGPGGPVAGVTR